MQAPWRTCSDRAGRSLGGCGRLSDPGPRCGSSARGVRRAAWRRSACCRGTRAARPAGLRGEPGSRPVASRASRFSVPRRVPARLLAATQAGRAAVKDGGFAQEGVERQRRCRLLHPRMQRRFAGATGRSGVGLGNGLPADGTWRRWEGRSGMRRSGRRLRPGGGHADSGDRFELREAIARMPLVGGAGHGHDPRAGGGGGGGERWLLAQRIVRRRRARRRRRDGQRRFRGSLLRSRGEVAGLRRLPLAAPVGQRRWPRRIGKRQRRQMDRRRCRGVAGGHRVAEAVAAGETRSGEVRVSPTRLSH
jgi:hypothetical protein